MPGSLYCLRADLIQQSLQLFTLLILALEQFAYLRASKSAVPGQGVLLCRSQLARFVPDPQQRTEPREDVIHLRAGTRAVVPVAIIRAECLFGLWVSLQRHHALLDF